MLASPMPVSVLKKDPPRMEKVTPTQGLDFRPFKAWRYHPDRVSLSQVLAPPYDVISPKEQEALYSRSPYNVVRLILGKESDFYHQARERWQAWSREKILVQDPTPAFYLYEQVFRHPWDSRLLKRLAVVGTLKLEEPGSVLRHEATFEAPRKDRLQLLERTQTNLSLIFGLYQDSKKRLAALFSKIQTGPLLFQAEDDQGLNHHAWAIQKEEDQKLIHEALFRQKILIADGHHRYETALEYRRQMREKFPVSGEAPFDFVMMAIVAFEDEGLLVLPTHRILRSLGFHSHSSFLEKLQGAFDLFSYPEKQLFSELSQRPDSEKVFGGFFGEAGNFLLRLKNLEAVRPLLPQDKPAIWYETEANLLNAFVLGRLAGLSEEASREGIGYTRSWEEAAESVRQGKAQAAFLMRAPKIQKIYEFAETGERMPQKTTYFYPKLASGLFFYHHDTA